MEFTYPAVFFKKSNGGYNVCFPDCDYLGISGANMDYAREFGAEDLKAYLITQIETHQPIPKPTPLADVDIQKVLDTLALPFTVESYSKENITVNL